MKTLKKAMALSLAILLIIFSSFSVFSASEPPSINMAVLGDSIASGYGLENIYDSYSALIAIEKHYHIGNSAVDGHTSSDLLWVVCHDDVAREDITNSDLVVISIGGNDILQLLLNSDGKTLLDILTNGANSRAVKEAVKNLKEKLLFSCTEIRTLNPQVPIILQSLYNPLHAHEDYKALAPTVDKLAPLFSEILLYVSQELENIFIADIYTAFDNHYNKTGDFSIIQSDGIHPSEKGHKLIAQEILKVIDNLEQQGLIEKASDRYYRLGDPDGSDSVTISDATLIQKYLASLVTFWDDIVLLSADADRDGSVTIKDATAIQKHLALLTPDSDIDSLIPYFPQ